MAIIKVPYSTVKSFQPQNYKGFACDGFVNGQPVKIRKYATGGMVASVGSHIETVFGLAKVVANISDCSVLEIVSFNDDYERVVVGYTPTGEVYEKDIMTSHDMVAKLARMANKERQMKIVDIQRIMTTRDGNLTTEGKERIEALRVYEDNQFRFTCTLAHEHMGDALIICDTIPIDEDNSNKLKAVKRKHARKIHDACDDMPDDIASEIASEFSDDDAWDGDSWGDDATNENNMDW